MGKKGQLKINLAKEIIKQLKMKINPEKLCKFYLKTVSVNDLILFAT